MCEEAIDKAMDESVEAMATERIHAVADIPLAQVIRENNLDVNRILHLLDEVEED